MKNTPQKNGFTLLEMTVVMIIVAVLLFVTLPNIQQKEKIIRTKGCEALLEVINSQIMLYEIDHGMTPASIDQLVAEGYLRETQTACPDGSATGIENGQAVRR